MNDFTLSFSGPAEPQQQNQCKIVFIGNNVRTTNARWPIKGCKDVDFRFRLVFCKKQILPLGVGPRAGDLVQKCLNLSIL